MWIWEGAACGSALAGDSAAAARWLEKVRAGSKDNEAAHTRALLCLDRLDEAEALLLKRLAGDDPEEVLRKVQDYRLGPGLTATQKLIDDRFRAVVARPAVQAAIAKVGRTLSLPLSKTYWGDV
jgi:hypothetical protein